MNTIRRDEPQDPHWRTAFERLDGVQQEDVRDAVISGRRVQSSSHADMTVALAKARRAYLRQVLRWPLTLMWALGTAGGATLSSAIGDGGGNVVIGVVVVGAIAAAVTIFVYWLVLRPSKRAEELNSTWNAGPR